MERKIKTYDNFNLNEDYGSYDTGPNDLSRKDEIYFNLKNSSEEILKVVGFEHEVKWFDLLNQLYQANDEEELDEVMIEIDEFLKEHDYNE